MLEENQTSEIGWRGLGRVLTQAPFAFWEVWLRRIWPRPPAKSSRRPQGFGFLPAEEIHAEVCYAECLLQRAALTFLQVGALSLHKQPGDFRRWITMPKPVGSIAATIRSLVV